MNKFELLNEYVQNKIFLLDREILELQAKKEVYEDIEFELKGYIDEKEEEK